MAGRLGQAVCETGRLCTARACKCPRVSHLQSVSGRGGEASCALAFRHVGASGASGMSASEVVPLAQLESPTSSHRAFVEGLAAVCAPDPVLSDSGCAEKGLAAQLGLLLPNSSTSCTLPHPEAKETDKIIRGLNRSSRVLTCGRRVHQSSSRGSAQQEVSQEE